MKIDVVLFSLFMILQVDFYPQSLNTNRLVEFPDLLYQNTFPERVYG